MGVSDKINHILSPGEEEPEILCPDCKNNNVVTVFYTPYGFTHMVLLQCMACKSTFSCYLPPRVWYRFGHSPNNGRFNVNEGRETKKYK